MLDNTDIFTDTKETVKLLRSNKTPVTRQIELRCIASELHNYQF